MQGPISLTISATPGKAELHETVEVYIEALAERGVTVTLDSYARALHADERRFEYRILRSDKEVAAPADAGKLRWSSRHVVEFILAGSYELPGASLSYVDERATSDDEPARAAAAAGTLETKPLTIDVTSAAAELSDEEVKTVAALDPIELPRQWSRWWWLGPVLAVAGLLLVVLLLWSAARYFPRLRSLLQLLRGRLSRRAGDSVAASIPAQEWARRELAALVAEDLITRRLFHPFYYRVSDIVRGYVERRFEVSAPEMTTEEFLAAAARDLRFGTHNTTELVDFLTACDLVKYAGFEPDPAESGMLLQAAEAFVERTRERADPLGENTRVTGAREGQAA